MPPTDAILALTSTNPAGTIASASGTLGALISSSDLLVSAYEAGAVGSAWTLADGNTGTTVDTNGSLALVHLVSAETSVASLAYGSIPSPTGQFALSNGTSNQGEVLTHNQPGQFIGLPLPGVDVAHQGFDLTVGAGSPNFVAVVTGQEGTPNGTFNDSVELTPANTALIAGWVQQADAAATTPVVSNPPTTQPPQPQPGILRQGNATIYDTTTQTYIADSYSHPYMGPVAGLQYDCEPITPDSLNITARENSMFIKTSSGNDAVALLGGTNVVDAGTGSNFLTAGGGFDTFFLDSRNVPAASSAAGPVPGAIWDTIQGIVSGDAATLWGIGPGTALDWQKNQGAVGHTGLTLHANMPNGSETSLTLAGIDSKAGLSLSYGSSGGSSYLYVKAA